MHRKIIEHFKVRDPRLHTVSLQLAHLDLTPSPPENYFKKLTRHIVYQQISGKAGDAIWARFEKLTGEKPDPASVIEIAHERLRSVGLSNSKATYVKNIAEFFVNGKINPEEISKLDDEEIITLLTQIKGVGRWTAEMFLMFTLGREDVFSVGDLGLRKGYQKVYAMKKEPSIKYLERMTKKWSPYRSYASLVLWASLDNLNPQ